MLEGSSMWDTRSSNIVRFGEEASHPQNFHSLNITSYNLPLSNLVFVISPIVLYGCLFIFTRRM